jgi:uncharacterized protein YbjT (DUF2867 family)
MTSFWDHTDKQKAKHLNYVLKLANCYIQEIDDGILMINAAKAAKVDLLIWSGLMSVNEASGGKYSRVDHFDGKAAVTAYGRQSGVPFVDVQAGLYASNFTNALVPRKAADGSYELALPFGPETVIPVIDMESDYGMFVRQAIESPAVGPGSEILTCGELISLGDMFKQLSESLLKADYAILPNTNSRTYSHR